PEIKLGIIPGAGGTQRLPRLIGLEKALAMILTGEPITAPDALAHGLVDEIVEGDVTAAAVTFARKVAAEQRPLVLARDRTEKLAATDRAKFDGLAAGYLKRGKGLLAPMAAVEMLRNALDLPIDDALRREWDVFLELLRSEQAKSQRHIFFAEREAAKISGIPAGTRPREIRRAAVIGGGTMGGGSALCFGPPGVPVAAGGTAGGRRARARDRHGREELQEHGRARRAQAGGGRAAHRADPGHDRHGSDRRGRHRDRGGVREDGGEATGVRRARQGRQGRRGARDQH